MKILHVAAECFPVAKVGGLADVVGALPKYQNSTKQVSEVVMPFYDVPFTSKNKFEIVFEYTFPLNGNHYSFSVKKAKNFKDFNLYLIDLAELFFNKGVYESKDEVLKNIAFQIAVLHWVNSLDKKPNVVHVHDHHTGLIPFMMTQSFIFEGLKNIPTLFTIHNAQYQGWFSHDRVSLLPKFDFSKVGLLDWNGEINPMAAAIKSAWEVTTVSPSYMKELQKKANGLEMLLNYEKGKCSGIVNGIDNEVWDPKTDNNLIENFGLTNFTTGKKKNKEFLCKQFGFDVQKPLFVFIGRLVEDKGCDLFFDLLHQNMQQWDANFLFLGSGSEAIQEQLFKMNKEFKGKYHFENAYNEKLSRIMYAGADYLLMPSRIEPCGLNQLYALRYGTIPIVNNVGGLKDTIFDIDEENGFGIVMENVSIQQLTNAVDKAIELFNTDLFKKVRKSMMKLDHSWKVSAKEYQKIYKNLKG